jgi:hypothetical protein
VRPAKQRRRRTTSATRRCIGRAAQQQVRASLHAVGARWTRRMHVLARRTARVLCARAPEAQRRPTATSLARTHARTCRARATHATQATWCLTLRWARRSWHCR